MRRIWAFKLAVLAMLAAAAPASAGLTVRKLDLPQIPEGGDRVATAPDGSLLRLAFGFSFGGEILVRVRLHGAPTSIPIPQGVFQNDGTLTILSDGAVAFVGTHLYDAKGNVLDHTYEELVTLPSGSRRPRTLRLADSGSSLGWGPIAVAPDGAIWRARTCGDILARTSSAGAETRIRLAPSPCPPYLQRQGAGFVFGPDGAVWYVSPCQARVVRIPLVGPRREWRLPARPRCRPTWEQLDQLEQDHPRALPTADGGLRFEGGRIDRHGRLRLSRGETLPDAIAPDGTQWSWTHQQVEGRAPGGRVVRLTTPPDDPSHFVAGAIGPDGRFWYLKGVVDDELSLGDHLGAVRVGVADMTGRVAEQLLPDDASGDVLPRILPGAAGNVWLAAPLTTLSVTLDAIGPARVRARATRVLARRRGTVWIQVVCAARPGTFCVGSARLVGRSGRGLARSVATFAIPGGGGRAIPLTLTAGARRSLGRGPLAARALVRIGGRIASTRVRLR